MSIIDQTLAIDKAPAARSGLLALIVAARRFGIHASADRLAHDNNLRSFEVSVPQLLRCAVSIGLVGEAISVGWDALEKLRKALPAIVQLTNGSYLLLHRLEGAAGAERAVLQDPCSKGEALIVLERGDFERVWRREVVLLKRNYDLADEDRPFAIPLIVAMIVKEKRVGRDVVISALALALLALSPIIFWRLLVDRVLPYNAFSTFTVLCLVMGILIAFEAAFCWLRRFLLVGLTVRLDTRIATHVFSKVLGLSLEFFERNPAGGTLHKMYQIGRIRQFLQGQLFGTVLDSAVLVVFIPVMFFFNSFLTLVVLGFCAAICVIIVCAMPSLRRRMSDVEQAETDRGSFLNQTVQGIRTVKSMALDSRQRHEWDVLTARVAEARADHGHFSNLIQTAVLPFERLAVSGGLAVGVYIAISTNSVSEIGALLSFMMLSQRIAGPLIQISQLIQQFDEARIAIHVIGRLVNQPAEEGRDGTGVRKDLTGYVEFSGVTFQYKGALRPALRDLTFEVPRGTTLGVMGRSGSGKTTITRLLQRLHSDYTGLIKIDGVDVRQYDVDHLRASLGVVLQENFLFSGTLRENITIAKPDATYDDMVAAARLAGAEEFIDKLPAGYETFIYEGSPNLSGGQRQRIAIARALITDPKILILDEATSALDAESEAIVNSNIGRIAEGRTVITISHRLSALVKADAIMVLDGGVIDDIGKHEELLERNDIYAGLWYTQNQHAGAPPAKPSRPKLAYGGPTT